MAFMEPQVYETDYLVIDGPYGGEIIPCDVADYDPSQWPKQGDCEDDRSIPPEIRDYCENKWAYTIEREHGWVGRMSAPGYTDATSWISGATEKEVREELANRYGDEEG
jgi:hypothetical protein